MPMPCEVVVISNVLFIITNQLTLLIHIYIIKLLFQRLDLIKLMRELILLPSAFKNMCFHREDHTLNFILQFEQQLRVVFHLFLHFLCIIRQVEDVRELILISPKLKTGL